MKVRRAAGAASYVQSRSHTRFTSCEGKSRDRTDWEKDNESQIRHTLSTQCALHDGTIVRTIPQHKGKMVPQSAEEGLKNEAKCLVRENKR
jgi:hypothetical protein